MQPDMLLLSLFIDLLVVLFDLLIFCQMISLRKDTKATRTLMYSGSAMIILSYFAATYYWKMPSSVAAAVCMSIPSLIFFFCLSKYKDSRFFLTFCFVDTVSLILGFWGRYASLLLDSALGSVAVLALLFGLCLSIFLVGKPYFRKYHKLLEYGKDGWNVMMLCTIVIYVALIVFASTPVPLVERLQDAPKYGLFTVVVLCCYSVFLDSAVKTRRIYEQSQQLLQEKKWHTIAFIDSLTGIGNRTAYIAAINDLERALDDYAQVYLIVLDVDNLKLVNDTLGHSRGDRILQKTAEILRSVFEKDAHYRIGGDEFVVIVKNTDEPSLKARLENLDLRLQQGLECSLCRVSMGYERVDPSCNNAVEAAFSLADANMYRQKQRHKQPSGQDPAGRNGESRS